MSSSPLSTSASLFLSWQDFLEGACEGGRTPQCLSPATLGSSDPGTGRKKAGSWVSIGLGVARGLGGIGPGVAESTKSCLRK